MGKQNVELHLHPSLAAAAECAASACGMSLNQFVNMAVAEKLSAIETETYFRGRAGKSAREAFMRFLDEAGEGAPMAGDEMPSA